MGRALRLLRILTTTWHYRALAVRHPDRVESVTRRWGRQILHILDVRVTVSGKPSLKEVIYVGNHVGYLDIPFLMSVTPVTFLAKKELGSWPLFGKAMKAVGVLFVDRSSKASRAKVGDVMAAALKETGRPVGVFPSGTTTADESVPWRYGIFLTAKKYDIPIQPFRFTFRPLRQVAYIGNDTFLPHLWRFLKQPVEAKIEFLEPRLIKDPQAECAEMWHWTRQVVH